MTVPDFSVVIPVLNEVEMVGSCLEAVRGAGTVPIEIIVVDGGSSDGTAERAAAEAAVLRCERGRARQLNAGARAARGETLLFLHADTLLPPGAFAAIAGALRDPRVVGGAFALDFRERFRGARLLAFGANLRARLFRLPLGDQALFVRREAFEALGGFPDLPLLEDAEFVRRLRGRGRVRLLRERVRTSARRWRRGGALVTLRNWTLLALHAAGVSPATLKQWYPDTR